MFARRSVVLTPQYFGSLVFDRRTSRYLPFDREATVLLLALCDRPIDAVLADIPDPAARGRIVPRCSRCRS